MSKKRFLAVVTIDDPEDNITELPDAATWVEAALGRSPTGSGIVVTAYSTAADAAKDEAERAADFAEEADPVPVKASPAPSPI